MAKNKKDDLPGYHFAQSTDGAFAVEEDQPCEGVVTVTWKPQEYPGKSASIEMPQILFDEVVKSYVSKRGKGQSDPSAS